jgi:hypothetical protein
MRLTRPLLACVALVIQAPLLLAQAPAPAAPPAAAPAAAPAQAIPPAPAGQGWLAVVAAVVLIVAVGVASFMSAKRTHQD